jgi:hypothetical protein
MSAERDRAMLSEQREAIIAKIEDAALAVLADQGDEGAALVAAVLRQAADIARWVAYDPPSEPTPTRVTCPECGASVKLTPNGFLRVHRHADEARRCLHTAMHPAPGGDSEIAS